MKEIRILLRKVSDVTVNIKDCTKRFNKRQAPSLKASGQRMQYICRGGDREYHLFHDDQYWFWSYRSFIYFQYEVVSDFFIS